MNAYEVLASLDACGALPVERGDLVSVLENDPFIYVIPDSNRRLRFENSGKIAPSYCYVPVACTRQIDTDKSDDGFIRMLGGTIVNISGLVTEVLAVNNDISAIVKKHGVGKPSSRTVREQFLRRPPANFEAYLTDLVAISARANEQP